MNKIISNNIAFYHLGNPETITTFFILICFTQLFKNCCVLHKSRKEFLHDMILTE